MAITLPDIEFLVSSAGETLLERLTGEDLSEANTLRLLTALRKDYASLGAQLDMRINVLHWYAMTLSAGYARGFESGRRADSEWMLSLKIM